MKTKDQIQFSIMVDQEIADNPKIKPEIRAIAAAVANKLRWVLQ